MLPAEVPVELQPPEVFYKGGRSGESGGAGGWNGHSLENEGSPGFYGETMVLR
jgi:hypothetical protein